VLGGTVLGGAVLGGAVLGDWDGAACQCPCGREETRRSMIATAQTAAEIGRRRCRGVSVAATAASKTGIRLNNMPEGLCRGACGTRCRVQLAEPHTGREMREST
jgi:hypothetical protein